MFENEKNKANREGINDAKKNSPMLEFAGEFAAGLAGPNYYKSYKKGLDHQKGIQEGQKGSNFGYIVTEVVYGKNHAYTKGYNAGLNYKEEKKRKHEEWVERMRNHIERWENNVERAENRISRIEENIEKLEDMLNNARTEEFADRVRGWVENDYQKIEESRRYIRSCEEKISSVRSKLNE